MKKQLKIVLLDTTPVDQGVAKVFITTDNTGEYFHIHQYEKDGYESNFKEGDFIEATLEDSGQTVPMGPNHGLPIFHLVEAATPIKRF